MQNFDLEFCCRFEDTSPSQFCSNWISIITFVTGVMILKVSEQLPNHSLTRWLKWNLGYRGDTYGFWYLHLLHIHFLLTHKGFEWSYNQPSSHISSEIQDTLSTTDHVLVVRGKFSFGTPNSCSTSGDYLLLKILYCSVESMCVVEWQATTTANQ